MKNRDAYSYRVYVANIMLLLMVGRLICAIVYGAIAIIAFTFVNKPGRSGSARLQFGAIANNGTAVPEALMNIHFQTGYVIF
ncbi:hypothetical protein D3C87_1390420 [compost metagenome]